MNFRQPVEEYIFCAPMLQWYKLLQNKRNSTFICFDVIEFYSSRSEALLNGALYFASQHVNISATDRQIIVNAKHSLLFSNGQPWTKRNSNSLFDVTMGCYDGAETCELVCSYLLSRLNKIPRVEIGLYRDDGSSNRPQGQRRG